MLQIIEQFQNLQFQVTFVSPAIKPETAFDLSTINVLEKSIELNHDSFDAFLLSLSPEIVLFDRFLMEEQFGWRVAQ
ncbi:glycosyltransferase, partial [Saccharophagus degradans]|nr:glycosyltransferase [Saccharophagus degradans]